MQRVNKHAPDNPRAIEFDVKDMAVILPSEFADHLPSTPVPDLDCAVIAPTDKTPAQRIEREGTHEVVVRCERAEALARIRVPYLDLLVVRARHDEVFLELDARETAVVALKGAEAIAGDDVP